jgi:diamine N-acetyltransferase
MITIRPATPQDYPTIQQIAHQTWPETFGEILSPQQIDYMLDWMYSLPSLQAQVAERGHVFLLAEEAETVLGFLAYELNYQEQPKTKIHKIYILPSSQGKGVGKGLIGRASEIATEQGNVSLLLNVNRYNKAVQFYQKMGFEVVGQEDIDIGNGFLMEDFILEKNLL